MPTLLLQNNRLVKTTGFKDPRYLGDPINTARIFNELEVDELVLFDIGATTSGAGVEFDLVERIAAECFMPICYGGGVSTLEDFDTLFRRGIEKVSVSSLAFSRPDVVTEAAERHGSQSIVATLDIRRSRLTGRYTVVTHNGSIRVPMSLEQATTHITALGVGELIVNAVDREGTWQGFDSRLIREVVDRVECPVVALGGAGSIDDIATVVRDGNASAVAIGSMASFQARGMGVLINFPSPSQLEKALA